ncbi:MAG TPA: hypothetical protein VEY09_11570 [Pyrinomonadaceae bacterium]|nr:hypothetical protein [Pyrinomonadaceae bacterium]
MRFVPPALLSAIILLAAAHQAPAQKKLCPKPPPSPFKHSGEIVTTIDRAARGMRTRLEHPRPLAGPDGAYYFGATFVHTDPRAGRTPTVDLVFYGTTAVAKLGGGSSLSFVADGRPVALAQAASLRSQPAGATFNESAKVTMSLAEVMRLTAARKVSVQLGGSQLELTHNHLEALRELVSQMAPAPSRWATAGSDALSAR